MSFPGFNNTLFMRYMAAMVDTVRTADGPVDWKTLMNETLRKAPRSDKPHANHEWAEAHSRCFMYRWIAYDDQRRYIVGPVPADPIIEGLICEMNDGPEKAP